MQPKRHTKIPDLLNQPSLSPQQASGQAANVKANNVPHDKAEPNVTDNVGQPKQSTPLSLVPQTDTVCNPPNFNASTISQGKAPCSLTADNTGPPARLPPISNLPFEDERIYDPRYTRRAYPPIPSVHSLFETVRRRGIDLFSNSSEPEPEPGLASKRFRCPSSLKDRLLGKRRKSELTAEDLGPSRYEPDGQPPLKYDVLEPGHMQNRIPQTNEHTGKPSKKLLGGSYKLCQSSNWQSSNVESTKTTIQPRKVPEEQPRRISSEGTFPSLPCARVPSAFVTQENPHLIPQGSSEPRSMTGQLPSMKEMTRSLDSRGAHWDPNTPQSGAEDLKRARLDRNTNQGNPRSAYYGPLPQQNEPAISPMPANNASSGNMMYVNNFWQNVYLNRNAHAPAAPQYGQHELPPLARTPPSGRAPPRALKILPHSQPAEPEPNPACRKYDLAKIRRLGFIVINGRVYNQQNHPMCAAPRENGNPCKRNVSRSPCRWHGEVVMLTRQNTKNGLLDEFGNLIRTGPSASTNRAAATRSSQPSSPYNHGRAVPMSQPFTPPVLLSRTLRWNNEEHYWFLLGLQTYGKKWSTIAKVVGTRNTLQVQSHAQKFFERQNKVEKKKSTIHDLKIESHEMARIAARYTDAEREKRLTSAGGPYGGESAEVHNARSGAGPSSHRCAAADS